MDIKLQKIIKSLELKVERSISWLTMNQPFFAAILLGMKIEMREDLKYKTMATNGRYVYWHPEYVEKWCDTMIRGTFCHEALHPGFLHHIRQDDREHERWNKACDYEINPIVRKAGHDRSGHIVMSLPPNTLYEPRYEEMSAEVIYGLLPPEPEDAGQGGGFGNWNIGDVISNPGMSESDKKIEEDRIKITLNQASQLAKVSGKMPAGLDAYINDILSPRIDWMTVLRRFVNEMTRNDYCWRLPNKRYISQGIYMPFMESPTVGNGAVAIDLSSSMDINDITLTVSEAWGVISVFEMELFLLWFDTVVQNTQTVKSGDDPDILEPKGRGGTDFRAPFNWLDENDKNPNFLIVMTDGCDNSYPDTVPPYPVLWMLTGKNSTFNPPFGEIVTFK